MIPTGLPKVPPFESSEIFLFRRGGTVMAENVAGDIEVVGSDGVIRTFHFADVGIEALFLG